jgi:RecA-family ATPase
MPDGGAQRCSRVTDMDSDARIDSIINDLMADSSRVVKPGATPASCDDQRLVFVSPADWVGMEPPPRKWLVEGWLPIGATTIFYGHGGTGKSLLGQMLMTACAAGKSWLGMPCSKGPACGLFCEDSTEEVFRRQIEINAALGTDLGDLGAMLCCSAVGQQTTLFRTIGGAGLKPTPRFFELKEDAQRLQARLIFIDTAADTFEGDEIDRTQVRAYISGLNELARELDAAVLVAAHPSQRGMSPVGDGDSGSTAWHNSSRSRWFLEHAGKPEKWEKPEWQPRILSLKKANYGGHREPIRLHYRDKVLVPAVMPTASETSAAEGQVDAKFLEMLDRAIASGLHMNPAPNAATYAPKYFAENYRAGFSKKELAAALHRLLAAEAICIQDYGRASGNGKRPQHIVRAKAA